PRPALAGLVVQRVALELAPAAPPARRLVETPPAGPRLATEPLPDRDLLLVAAAQTPCQQLGPRRPNAEAPDRLLGEPALVGDADDAATRDLLERCEADVAADRVLEDQPFSLAI